MKKCRKWKFLAIIGVTAFSLSACKSSATSQNTAVQTESETSAAEEALPENVARTTAGLVRGTNEDGIYRYLGVPYAEAKERFVPAEEVTPWDDIREATEYGAMSPQGSISGLGDADDQSGTDNNAQNLNIWTPGLEDGKKRPVMVWLHGGGFSTGSANEAGYDGENLSREGDVVVVGVNHRLNTFGFLDLSAYGEKYQYSENVGIMDIVDALEWVRDNIEYFGGDPDNVTVFGQSGGGAKVLALMTSPYAKDLFNKGIVQSGATETMGVVFNFKEASERLTENILSKLGITAENIEDIQSVPVDELQAAATEALTETGEELKLPAALGGGYSMDWEPVIDGDFLPTNPVTEDGFAEAGKDVTLLIGSNLNEWSGFFEADPIEVTEELTEALHEAYPDKTDLTADQVDTTTIRLPLLKIMCHKADQGGASVYAYVFTYGNSFHGAEIPYVFDNPAVDATDEEKRLAEQVSTAWINFAKTGVPSADGLPTWEAYTHEGGATMLLDTKSTLTYNHDKTLMDILFPDYMAKLDGVSFPLGQKVDSPSFEGAVYISPMITKDDTYHFPATNNIIFEPGARSSWHSHGGMTVLVTGGVGYYQEEGKPAQILRKGDVVEIPEGTRHWHGAVPYSWFSQMVIYDADYMASAGEAAENVILTDAEYQALETEEYTGRTEENNSGFTFIPAKEAVKFDTFSGAAYVSDIVGEDNAAGAPGLHYVVFDLGVINNWHTHEGGQILIATDGIGYHQVEGGKVQVMHPGDVAFCPPGVKHWHGGSLNSSFAHIAVNTNPDKPGVEWFDRISDAEYLAIEENAD